MKDKFYLTTSIAYTNAPPHIGYALELIQADAIARYQRLLGKDVFFLTGTDEHGQKVVRAAEIAKKTPEVFCDEISAEFKELKEVLNLSNDDFIRTTDKKKHWPSVQEFWRRLKEVGDIYKKKYQGLYCVGCEAFITQKDLIDGKCKIHQAAPQIIEEENYFFKLSKYSGTIQTLIESDKVRIIPIGRKNEMLSFIGQGLEDVSFSRPRKDLEWGVPVPDDDTQTIYVWADALVNYISALGGFNSDKFKNYWPPDVQCIGKDILRFHAVIWLGMLLSLGLELPKIIFVHGYITSSGQKMSKSLGNVIDPFELVEKYGADAVRYFLLREITPTEDGDYTRQKFEERYNSDLASGLGNLVARVITLSAKLKMQNVKVKITNQNLKFKTEINEIQKKWAKSLEEFKLNEALMAIWELISFCDRHIEKEKAWQENKKQKEIIGNLLTAISEIVKLLKPFLPETAGKIEKQLKNQKGEALFPRLE